MKSSQFKALCALLLGPVMSSSTMAENKVSYFESEESFHDDFVLVVMQSGECREFKLCNRNFYKAGTLDLTNPQHCSAIGKTACQAMYQEIYGAGDLEIYFRSQR